LLQTLNKKSLEDTSVTEGTFGANVSFPEHWVNIEGLDKDTKYYFSAWTFTSDTGSPYLEAFSSSPATTSGTTVGGSYNISIKYEDNPFDAANRSRSFVNLSTNLSSKNNQLCSNILSCSNGRHFFVRHP
jgi:hypothetical protein